LGAAPRGEILLRGDRNAATIEPRNLKPGQRDVNTLHFQPVRSGEWLGQPCQTNASAVSGGAAPYLSGAMVKLARPWLTLRTAAE
jgi:hypothetical protein